VKNFLHRPDVHAAKSVMVMADVALVMAGIQLQLSMMHEQMVALKLGQFSASAHHHEHQGLSPLARPLCARPYASCLSILGCHHCGHRQHSSLTCIMVEYFCSACSPPHGAHGSSGLDKSNPVLCVRVSAMHSQCFPRVIGAAYRTHYSLHGF